MTTPARRITQFVVTVREYDEAIRFYTQSLGFELIEDTDMGNGKRWVRVRPSSANGPAVLLARATTPEQVASVGNQTGGRVFIFLETDDLRRDHDLMTSKGVRFVREPSLEPYGAVAVFEDLYGNRFDLIQPPPATPEITLERFRSCSIPLGAWNHRAHLTVAYLLLREHLLAEASRLMCEGVQRYNASQGIVQTPTGGYHETLTIAWMRILAATMHAHGHSDTPDQFFDHHTQLHSKVLLRLYYSRPRIMSDEARRGWVEPDLAPLPAIP